MSKAVLGAQLYTVRQFTQNAADFAASMKKIADIGYTAVQISGFGPADPKAVAQVMQDCNLTVASTHMGWDRFLKDLDGVIGEHKLWGCKHPAIGGLAGEYHSAEGVKRFVDELRPVAERLAAEGMDFSYHNHNHELIRYGGKTWLAMLYEQAPPEILKAEIDTYWITAGGGDPAAWVRSLGPRQPLLHCKDMAMAPGREQRFAPVGEGNLTWPAILDAAQEVDVEFYLVEQDSSYDLDPFEALATSFRNLKAMGLS
jgi:sugar phosphate isomerase/epimerase